ncbi:MAG TPA: ectonucleotide pyrophosphatase/phosphodiesterase [Opitutaceae bacterium]|nr:ectonucleotide pyrophosphatase/phosphodiesterase [Opitutaceae bacterium]
MKKIFISAVAVVAALLAGCAHIGHQKSVPPLLVLVSLDAFRWDYCALHPNETPHLHRLMREGSTARQLIPTYPSNTFSNHYTIVTGLYPSHHGIINNEFFDPALGEFFRYTREESAQKSQWWGGEPIWVTARKQGLASACSFWPGSNAVIAGLRPNFWRSYQGDLPFEKRLEEFRQWLQLPPKDRPSVVTFYFEEGNSVGHKYGPGSPELLATIKTLDERIGAIVDQLRGAGLEANLVVVSDHGLTPISKERIILLNDFIDPTSVQVDFDGPVAGLRPRDGDSAALLRKLSGLQNAKAYAWEELPARFQITRNPRNPPVWIVPDEGWEIYFRARFEQFRDKFNRADHGYDTALDSMRGILIAQGPAFKAGGTIGPVENIHVYNLLCATLAIKPAPNDGDDRLVRAFLKK